MESESLGNITKVLKYEGLLKTGTGVLGRLLEMKLCPPRDGSIWSMLGRWDLCFRLDIRYFSSMETYWYRRGLNVNNDFVNGFVNGLLYETLMFYFKSTELLFVVLEGNLRLSSGSLWGYLVKSQGPTSLKLFFINNNYSYSLS